MADIRKIIIIFVIAVLFSVLVFAVIEAVYPQPKYEDYCKNANIPAATEKPCISQQTCPEINISQAERDACTAKKGNIEYTNYDTNNCPKTYECNTCQNEFNLAMEKHSRYVFYISAFLALVAIFLGLYLPAKKNSLNEWVGTGFMLGGTFALFFGTLTSFMFLDRYVRPIVIFLELVLVIFITYRKIGNLREDKKRKR
jgi:TRAP-type uncharacterized transport system fused permease subunit